jgi:hypothetical protein
VATSNLFYVDQILITWTDADDYAVLNSTIQRTIDETTNAPDWQLIRLDWVLTPTADVIQRSVAKGEAPNSLFALSAYANSQLDVFLQKNGALRRLNLIMVDFFHATSVVRASIALNQCRNISCSSQEEFAVFQEAPECPAAPPCGTTSDMSPPLPHVVVPNIENLPSQLQLPAASSGSDFTDTLSKATFLTLACVFAARIFLL